MWTDDYVREKLCELDAELAHRAPHRAPLDARFARRTPVRPRAMPTSVVGSLVQVAGRALHRTGHRLESWATRAAPEGDAAWVVATTDTPGPLLSWWKEGC